VNGGQLALESANSGGSRFRITLPQTATAPAPVAALQDS